MRVSSITATLWAALVSSAHAFCVQPSAYISLPTPPFSSQVPTVPYCVQQYRLTGQASCQQYEIDQYRDEMDRYVKRLQAYVDDAYEQARTAINFAKDAEAYAKCQVKQVSGQ